MHNGWKENAKRDSLSLRASSTSRSLTRAREIRGRDNAFAPQGLIDFTASPEFGPAPPLI